MDRDNNYLVKMDGIIIAERMELQDALLIIEGLAAKYQAKMKLGTEIELAYNYELVCAGED